MPTALDALRQELKKVQQSQSRLTDETGIVYASNRYLYQKLAQQAAEIHKSIHLLEEIKQEKQEALTRRKG